MRIERNAIELDERFLFDWIDNDSTNDSILEKTEKGDCKKKKAILIFKTNKWWFVVVLLILFKKTTINNTTFILQYGKKQPMIQFILFLILNWKRLEKLL